MVKNYNSWLEKNSLSLSAKPNTQKEAYKNFFATTWSKAAPKRFFQYEVYYAKLLEHKKSRPFVILQNDYLNRACFEGNYHSITVAPISSRLKGGDYRVELNQREGLTKRSEIVINALGIIDVGCVEFERGRITKLTYKEKESLQIVLQKLFEN